MDLSDIEAGARQPQQRTDPFEVTPHAYEGPAEICVKVTVGGLDLPMVPAPQQATAPLARSPQAKRVDTDTEVNVPPGGSAGVRSLLLSRES